MSGLGISSDVDDLLSDLKDAQLRFQKELRVGHDEIAKSVATTINSRSAATPGFRRFDDAWRGSGVTGGARLTLRNTGRLRAAKSVFLGRRPLTRSGWNASRYDRTGNRLGGRRSRPGARPQAKEWVGNTWIAGLPGEGPYIVRDVAPEITADVTRQLRDVFDRATVKVWGTR